ncbi:Rhodanese-like_domain superfamily [Hexamita inflata]|uniref:Rhodanese-like domain superfamily n=1 Tax=Hexamita inflata TaxID=28002 RepID=A0AA86NY28_9EUKA|nr:Rhodanese-like domain superfamily [Hexamita inflata]
MKPIVLSARWLHEHISDISIRIYDISPQPQTQCLPYTSYINPKSFDTRDEKQIKQLITDNNIHIQSHIILYSVTNNVFKPFFILNYFGFEQISVFFDPLVKWELEKYSFDKYIQRNKLLTPLYIQGRRILASIDHIANVQQDPGYQIVNCTSRQKAEVNISITEFQKRCSNVSPLTLQGLFHEYGIDDERVQILVDDGGQEKYEVYFWLQYSRGKKGLIWMLEDI